jgi:hypothetical protein
MGSARARALRKAAASGHPLGRRGISSLWRSVPKKLLGQVSANIQLHIGDAFFMDTSLGNSAHDRSSHRSEENHCCRRQEGWACAEGELAGCSSAEE